MQITQIRIAGFKSFVDPTDVPVEEGLTGIVGPNGCGKSNLLEALRWAMGASSAKAMRGSEMDDLIFSGSVDRPARETAEVTLVLDNSERKAPAEFNASDTLEIERRLKRGVGSTYKLNGRTVRGKDIQLLFADASTGANSPALVRQGQISELIGAKPQNRRRILEEAAGISGLNTRRHEAELKLRAAETNLERLTELTAEVERQLESLKRQARKARKYKALTQEISGLEALAAHLRWQGSNAAKETARSALEAAKLTVEELTREDTVQETVRLKAASALAPLREAESLTSAKLGQARIALARAEAERKAAEEARMRLQDELDRIVADLQREQDMIMEAGEARVRAETELAALPHDDPSLGAAQEQAARTALEKARTKLRAAEDAVDALSEQLAETRARQQAARDNAQAQALREANLKTDAEKLRAELVTLGQTAELQAKLEAHERAETEAVTALEAATRTLEVAESKLETAQDNENAAAQPVGEIGQAIRALEGEISGLKRLLRKGETSAAPPVLDRVSTKAGYERAVAAALGDDLQASTDKAAPVHWGGANAHGFELPAGATPLTELTAAPEELAARLAQCGLVTPEDGPRMVAALKPGQRLVSEEGHLWRWDGFVRTPDAPVSAAAQLEQKARLEAALEELAPLQNAADTARATLEAGKQARQQAEDELRAARAAVPAAATTLDQARRATAAARQASDQAAMKQDAAQTALVRVEADLRAASQALAMISGDGTREADTDALATELTDARAALAKTREHEVETRGQLADLTRGREKAAARREGLERDLAEWTRRAEAAAERRDDLQARREDTAASLAGAANASDDTSGDTVEALLARVDILENERKQAADTLAEAETVAREAETAARQATAAASKSREAMAGATVMLETAEARFAEVVEIARNQFQRLPEGLLPLAKSLLDDEAIDGLTHQEAAQRADYLKRDRDQLGGVNMDAEEEAEELAARLGSQATEKADLTGAIAKLREGVDALNDEGRGRLLAAFETVNEHFKALFTALFRGGQAELRLIDADDPLAAGLEIFAQPPGKRLGTLQLMSGGEQALTAAALIFAVFLSNPAPVCVLDEVDAPLDDANVDRFCRMLDEMRSRTNTRFIVITHNAVTMSRMDRLFGVTMREKGVSKLVSVDLNTAEELVAAE